MSVSPNYSLRIFFQLPFCPKRARAALAVEKEAFAKEKMEYGELYENQQKELAAMLERHRSQNEEWLEKTRGEIDAEKRELAEQKVSQGKQS